MMNGNGAIAWLSLVGRILYGGIFAFNGLNHFMKFSQMTGYAAAKGVPVPSLAVIVTGLLLLVGGLMIVFGWKVRLGAALIAIFLLPTSFMMHNFWAVPAEQQMGEMINFMKNMMLLGAALMIMVPTHWPKALEKPGP